MADTDFVTEGQLNALITAVAGASVPTSDLGDLADVDVDTEAPATGDRLIFDGTDWVPSPPIVIAYDDSGSPVTTGVPAGTLFVGYDADG